MAARHALNIPRICSSRLIRYIPLILMPLLPSCGPVLTAGTSDAAAIAGAGAANAVTKSAAIATGIGLGVASGAQAGLQYAERVVHGAEQDRVAQAAGPLAPGVVGHWSVSHTVPIEADEHGDLVVTRVIGGTGFDCKEIVFSVDTTENKQLHRAFYTATVCRDGDVWKWASAEPATARWGFAAMRRSPYSWGIILALPILLGGCSSVALIAGVISGGAAGGATANPVVGFAVGVTVDAAADAGVKWFGRSRQNAEQTAIAQVAGTLAVGTPAPWHISHDIPIGNEHGTVQVVRLIDTPLGACREIVFSVEAGKAPPAWYNASVCAQAAGWRWASAEPAVPRWGYLQ